MFTDDPRQQTPEVFFGVVFGDGLLVTDLEVDLIRLLMQWLVRSGKEKDLTSILQSISRTDFTSCIVNRFVSNLMSAITVISGQIVLRRIAKKKSSRITSRRSGKRLKFEKNVAKWDSESAQFNDTFLNDRSLRQNDSCIKMGSHERHFNVSLIVRDKVTRQRPQTTTFEGRGEPKRIRAEVPLLTRLTPYR